MWRVEAPSCKTSLAAYISLYRLARESVGVVLTGEGADEALAAVAQWRYEPAKQGTKAVDVYFTVRVDFELQ